MGQSLGAIVFAWYCADGGIGDVRQLGKFGNAYDTICIGGGEPVSSAEIVAPW
jgi:hypothetical protein